MSAREPSTAPRSRRVYIYSLHPPAPNTTGAGLAICSQVQAFLDLGFDVEFVHFACAGAGASPPPYFEDITYTVVALPNEKPSLAARLPYWLGWPKRLSWRAPFQHATILRETKSRIAQDPDALHLFNYLATANVVPDLPPARILWACHEIESEYLARNFAIDQAQQERDSLPWEHRMLRRVAALEREVARRSGLVLCVAAAEASQINRQWDVSNAAYLPLSITTGQSAPVPEPRLPGDKLRLLHIGDVTHLPTLSSLQFLFTQVFPLFDPGTLARLQLDVVGKLPPDDPRVGMVMDMARPYPQAEFTGFAKDLHAVYQRSDLQIVASQQATGVRTRIIESWAMGLPVLSTTVGAGGVEHLAPGENILLIDNPHEFAECLRQLVHDSTGLHAIGRAGRATYEARFSRQAVAASLGELLRTHLGYRELVPETAPAGSRYQLSGPRG